MRLRSWPYPPDKVRCCPAKLSVLAKERKECKMYRHAAHGPSFKFSPTQSQSEHSWVDGSSSSTASPPFVLPHRPISSALPLVLLLLQGPSFCCPLTVFVQFNSFLRLLVRGRQQGKGFEASTWGFQLKIPCTCISNFPVAVRFFRGIIMLLYPISGCFVSVVRESKLIE